ncbi:MAG: hypothetical protein M3N48_05385 [Verrucomicrobiota bacterium]|nr:hypothetical protein [Verrucomicrobiota bacterium]
MSIKDAHPDEALRKAIYSRDLLQSRTWIEAADRMTSAMSVLEPRLETWCRLMRESEGKAWGEIDDGGLLVYMLLGGYAVENLCKGYLATMLSPAERELVAGGKLPPRFNHNVLELTKLTSISLTAGDESLLTRLEAIIVWRGRYPVPKSATKRQPTWDSTSDTKRIRAIIQRLRNRMSP